jgi:thioredoxin reductase
MTRAQRPPEVIVIGAGPYGLAVTAHLRAAGVEVRVFGSCMSFWRRHMPAGMLLRSPWTASSIGARKGSLSLAAYERDRGAGLPRPVPLADFVKYGRWVQERVAPDLDERRIRSLERHQDGFRAIPDEGDPVIAPRVVMATGLDGCAHRPPELSAVPADRVLHTAELAEPGHHAGDRVLVVGGGQSAIESAALLHEAGARVEVVLRAREVRWLTRSARLHRWSGPLEPLLYAPTDVGPPGICWIVATPGLFRGLPSGLAARIARRSIRPAASAWLVERTVPVTITPGRRIAAAAAVNGNVEMKLDDGSRREVDTVVLGTGFRPDVTADSLLDAELRTRVEHVDGYPVLGPGFESSVPGLHFVGAIAAGSFGPVMRFVSGTWYTGPAVARRIARAARRRPPPRGDSGRGEALADVRG